LNLFYGEVRQGKTTILNAIKWAFGGKFPDDIIKHGESRASIEIHFDKTFIIRKFRKDKHGVVKADKIEYIDENGEESAKPVEAIAKFLNPFLLNQNHLMDMNEPSRKRFFVELFGVDTSRVDTGLKVSEDNAKELRATIKGYGEVKPVKVDKPDIDSLKEEKKLIIDKHDEEHARVSKEHTRANNISSERKRWSEKHEELRVERHRLEIEMSKIDVWLKDNPEIPVDPLPILDTVSIDEKINAASADQIRYEKYIEDEKRRSKKAELQDELIETEETIKDLRDKKTALLTTINDKCDIKGLVFDDNGDFEYEGTTAGMLSTSQLMRLSSDLSKLYPEGFGLELIDRGESMGKAIFEFIEKAKEENKTILATIVGEKPADVPEEIGVFVVENGQIK
jgi:DNA repair exonuclease SbcCD ATPase subunit